MATKQDIPRKHAGKKVTDAQDKIIRRIQETQKLGTYLEAKHEYFENQESYDKAEQIRKQGAKLKKEKPVKDEPKKRRILTIAEAKLGVTMVLSQADCKKIGIKSDTLTKDAVEKVREKLGLPTRAELKAAKKEATADA